MLYNFQAAALRSDLSMNNPFDYTPDTDCREAFRRLTERLETLKASSRPEDISLVRELEEGKMLGVLIAEDPDRRHHVLYAFSGQLGKAGFHHPGFVGPVFDYLDPNGYFKSKEKEISNLNKEIARFENDILSKLRYQYNHEESRLIAAIEEYKEKCRVSKIQRKTRRETMPICDAEAAEMVRQSQFEKAELHRMKKRAISELEPYKARLNDAEVHLESLKTKRRSDSESLQKWLFDNFKVLNARGESRSLSEIFLDTTFVTPPSGAGECCAPKLLQEAYLRGWKPVSMAEYWYGRPKGGEVRTHGAHYPACRGKCLPVLTWMMEGLEVSPPLGHNQYSATPLMPRIIFENQWFCVVDKPSGMLSVPGKGRDISVLHWLEERYGTEKQIKMAHRLDQDTSGLLIATFGTLPYRIMQKMFAMRRVSKTYIAELEGDYTARDIPKQGHIEMPLSPDPFDRPRQRVDFEKGKEAATDYEFTGIANGRSRIEMHPITGRTHQLRVHAAAALGMSIAGDRLYGEKKSSPSGRLLLHAHILEFTFPIDRQTYRFELPVPF